MTSQFSGTVEAAVHEVGHLVTGLAMGREVEEISIDGEEGQVRYVLNDWEHGIREARRGLMMDVAGLLAEDLWDEWHCYGGWVPMAFWEAVARSGLKVYNGFHRASNGLRQGHGSGDLDQAVFKATAIGLAAHHPMGMAVTQARLQYGQLSATPNILGEILRAERRAEKLLKQHWAAVCNLAFSLMRRKSGLTGCLRSRFG